jgi:hypothetical protein
MIALRADEGGDWTEYEASEKYSSIEPIRADTSDDDMRSIRTLFESEGWPVNSSALSDPTKLVYYFGVFRDKAGRKLVGVRQATQFKGACRGRFISIIDDTLTMVADRVFKLDSHFDFIITKEHIYILHPKGFERIAELESSILASAAAAALELGKKITFLDFTSLADYVGKHTRAARLVSALKNRTDLHVIKREMFSRAAKESLIILEKMGRKLTPAKGNELGCLELLDDRRYTAALRPGPKSAYVAHSRRPVK